MKNHDSTAKSRLLTTSARALAAVLLTALLPVDTGLQAAPADEEVSHAKISMGKGIFRAWCRTCHGETGIGDGPMAEHLKVAPSDLTLLSENEGGLFYFDRVRAKIDGREKVRGHGSKDMPVWGEAFLLLDETGGEEAVRAKIDSLAHYLRSIQISTADSD